MGKGSGSCPFDCEWPTRKAEINNYHYLTLLLGSEDFVCVPVSSEVAKSQLERLPENLYKRNE